MVSCIDNQYAPTPTHAQQESHTTKAAYTLEESVRDFVIRLDVWLGIIRESKNGFLRVFMKTHFRPHDSDQLSFIMVGSSHSICNGQHCIYENDE